MFDRQMRRHSGEPHLEIYVERTKREDNMECTTGKQRVAFGETITQRADFFYMHKKRSGGAGQYACVIGFVELMEIDPKTGKDIEFVGGENPIELHPCMREGTSDSRFAPLFLSNTFTWGFYDALEQSSRSGNPVCDARLVLNDGFAHSVDSSELTFKLATIAVSAKCASRRSRSSSSRS